jgi:putative hydrolase of the HAD superfamily
MTIQAVCFDADGVVVYPQKQFSHRLALEYAITPQMTQPFFQGVFNECLVGKADLSAVLPPFLSAWGWKGSVQEFIDAWLRLDHVIDSRLIAALQNLRRAGVTCCLATSQEHNRAEYMKNAMGFQAAFDHLFFSCEIGSQKPDLAYFQYITEKLNLKKGSILFWDDSPENIAAARAFGWQAEIYTEFAAFEKIIKKVLPLYCSINCMKNESSI